MAKRRSRSLSLFQPGINSTARLEGLINSDEDGSTKESNALITGDEYDNPYESEEEEDCFPNGQISTNNDTKADLYKSDLEFVRALKLCANVNDSKSYKRTVATLKVDKIDDLKSMNNDEIRAKFDRLLKSIGRFRSFYSVVHDIDVFLNKNLQKLKHPEKPLQPPTAQSIFLKELLANGKSPPANYNIFKWGWELYNNLSVHQKSHYIKKHEKMMETYSRQLADFYEKYPNEAPIKKKITIHITPFNLYFDELKSVDDKVKRMDALEQWKHLPVKNKVNYIKRAFQYQEDEPSDDKKVTISNKEKILLEEHYGKPEKPPKSIYLLYLQESSTFQERPYKSLTIAEKQQLTNRLNELVRGYEEGMNIYIKKLKGETKKIEREELLKFLSKYKLSETTVAIKSPARKKLKRSTSLSSDASNDAAKEESVPKKKLKVLPSKDINEQVDFVMPIKLEAEVKSPLKNINSAPEVFVEEKKQSKAKEAKLAKKVTETSEELSPIKKEGVKKKTNKQPKKEKEEFTETKPPKTLFKYFVSVGSFKTLEKAKKKFRNLQKAEKTAIKNEYYNICESYIGRLREYLSSLKESEMKAFVHKMEQDKAKEEDSDDGLTSSEDESDSDLE